MYLINANRNIEDYIGGIFVGAILGPIALFFMGASQPQKK
jgi:F0F1-type ATP synthase assembly protein I